MKNDPLTGTLVGVLVASVLASIVCLYFFAINTREIRQSQIMMNTIQMKRQAITALVGDLVEYSKTHPGIDKLLEDANIKAKPGAATGNPVPAPKPATK